MGEKRLIKSYEFTTRARPKLTFSDKTKIRLNDDVRTDQALELKPDSAGAYDTGLGHTVKTWTLDLNGLKRWLSLDADEVLPDNTSIGYRVVMNGVDWYWDGAAWVFATLDAHWNTLAQINENLAGLTPNSVNFAFKVNLRSTDGVSTPRLRWIKALAKIDLEPWDDLIYDTVIRLMRANLRAVTAIEVAIVADTSLIDLSTTYKLENSGYNFSGVRAAYNLTTDPQKFSNIADSYTPGAARPDGTFEDGQVNLSAPILAGQVIRLEMEYEPEIAVMTNQDYYEVARLPAVVFERIEAVKLFNRHDQELNDGPGDVVRNLATGVGVEVPRPAQRTVLFEFAIHASPLDIARVSDAMDRWVGQSRVLTSWAFGETLNMDPVRSIETGDSSNLDDVVVANGAFQLRGVPFYIRDAQDVDLVQTVNMSMTNQ